MATVVFLNNDSENNIAVINRVFIGDWKKLHQNKIFLI